MSTARRMYILGPGSLSVLFFLFLTLLTGCAERQGRAQTDPVVTAEAARRADLAKRFGIEVMALRLTSAGTMLDFRYRVVDSQKAAALLRKHSKPYLQDPATGARLMVPSPAFVGPLRQTAVAPQVGKTYFILFSNPGRLLQQGCIVTLVLGNERFDEIAIM